MSSIDWVTVVSSGANLVIAGGTLWAARQAAIAARGSEQASRAAERQIDVAESSRKIQILPYIAIHSLKQDEYPSSTWLIIENVGPGAAINVEITIEEGSDYKIHDTVLLTDYYPIKEGIKVMPPGMKLDTILGSNLEVQNGVNDFLGRRFRFEMKYEDVEGKRYGPHYFTVERFDMHGRHWTESHNGKIEKILETISKTLVDISRNVKKPPSIR